jgi:hypothetical protein
VLESFLEDINNLINIGDVPALFDTDDMTEILDAMSDIAIA